MYQYTYKELAGGRYGIEDFAEAFQNFYENFDLWHIARVSFNVSLIAMQGAIADHYRLPPLFDEEAKLYEIVNYLVQAEPFLTGYNGRSSSQALNEVMWGIAKNRNRKRGAPSYREALAAGRAWPEYCQELIAAELADMEDDREEGLTRVPRHVQLLRDIAAVWPEGEGFFPTRDLIEAVKQRNPAMWGDMSGFDSLTPQGLGRILAHKFGIRSRRHPSEQAKRVRGYFLNDFVPAMSLFDVRLPG